MSAEHIFYACVAAYFLGLPVAAYAIGRWAGSRAGPLAVMWPALVLTLPIVLTLQWMADLGDKHSRALKNVTDER